MGSETDYMGRAWWKGSFPMWLVVILLTVIGYFFKRYVDDTDTKFMGLGSRVTDVEKNHALHEARLLLLETQNTFLRQSHEDIRRDQRTTLEKLDALNAKIKGN